ncbi:MAG: serine/threonine protein phosphatase 1 [Neolewinella sp.]|jgi:serine/threonine protein phosphatase 1
MPRYAISDIHGCPKTFRALLAQLNFNKTDELFLLGDYVDKGPDSYGVIEYIWQLKQDGYQLHCLRGNHERMFTNEVLRGEHSGTIPIQHHQEVCSWMLGLDYYLETPGYFLVHAGLNFRHPDPLEATYDMLWIRHWYDEIDRDWLGGRIIVHGHTPEPMTSVKFGIGKMREEQRVCIDSGCAHSYKGMGYLTALNLDTGEGAFQGMVD